MSEKQYSGITDAIPITQTMIDDAGDDDLYTAMKAKMEQGGFLLPTRYKKATNKPGLFYAALRVISFAITRLGSWIRNVGVHLYIYCEKYEWVDTKWHELINNTIDTSQQP